jgi:uncharacterized protein
MSDSSKILLTGGTGFIGQRFAEGRNDCIVVSRRPKSKVLNEVPNAADTVQWDSESELQLDSDQQITHVVNMMGESIADGRWNDEKKKRIRDSRVIGTKRLVEAISHLNPRPAALISFSAIGYYGSRGEEELSEQAVSGNDYLADVCRQWEAAANEATRFGIRVVLLRCGIVFGKGGALEKIKTPFKWGVGGKLGSGKQWMPWIHVDDLTRLVQFAIDNESIEGPVNAVAPELVRNTQFTKTIANVMHRPAFFPVPTFALKIALGEFANELLASRKVVPEKLEKSGFQFRYPTLKEALVVSLSK